MFLSSVYIFYLFVTPSIYFSFKRLYFPSFCDTTELFLTNIYNNIYLFSFTHAYTFCLLVTPSIYFFFKRLYFSFSHDTIDHFLTDVYNPIYQFPSHAYTFFFLFITSIYIFTSNVYTFHLSVTLLISFLQTSIIPSIHFLHTPILSFIFA